MRCAGCGGPLTEGHIETHDHHGRNLRRWCSETCLAANYSPPEEHR